MYRTSHINLFADHGGLRIERSQLYLFLSDLSQIMTNNLSLYASTLATLGEGLSILIIM